jgi:uncharacterized protein YcbK (DUF882 family)
MELSRAATPLVAKMAAMLVVLAGLAGAPARASSLPSGVPTQLARPAVPAGKAVGKSPARPGHGAGRGNATPVILYHVNHRETLRLRLSDEHGKPVRGLQGQMNRFLRCHYTNQQHAMNPRLTRLLYEIGQHYAGRRIEIVSGYRHPRFAKNPHSPHKQGLACDMRVPGVKNTELRDFFRQRFKNVGVGYYPNSSFVHLDVRRSASAFWIDYSGPGENALYARNAYDDLRTGRADRWKRTTIDPSWADSPDEDDAAGAEPGGVAEPAEGPEADVADESGVGAPSVVGPGRGD